MLQIIFLLNTLPCAQKYTKLRLKIYFPSSLMKLNWYVSADADYTGFIQGTRLTSYLMLIHLRRARENVVASLFKNKRKVNQKAQKLV